MQLNHLRERRQAVGLTYEQLAALAGVTAGTIANIERRRVEPQRATVTVLEAALSKAEQVKDLKALFDPAADCCPVCGRDGGSWEV